MEPDRKNMLLQELQSLQKPFWSYRDVMIIFKCGPAKAVALIKKAKEANGAVPFEDHKALSDVVIEIKTNGTTSREREIDNRLTELNGFRPAKKEESHA